MWCDNLTWKGTGTQLLSLFESPSGKDSDAGKLVSGSSRVARSSSSAKREEKTTKAGDKSSSHAAAKVQK